MFSSSFLLQSNGHSSLLERRVPLLMKIIMIMFIKKMIIMIMIKVGGARAMCKSLKYSSNTHLEVSGSSFLVSLILTFVVSWV